MNSYLFLMVLSFVNTNAFYNIYKFNLNFFFYNRKNNFLRNDQEIGNKSGEEKDKQIDTNSINKIIRLGRSKDQDGKSNIWSVEPRMDIIEQKPGDISDVNKNILVGGLVSTGIFASLPFLYFLNSMFPDPNNY